MANKTNLKREENQFIAAIEDMGLDPAVVEPYINDNYDSFFPSLPRGEYKKCVLMRVYSNYLCQRKNVDNRVIYFTREMIRFIRALPSDKLKRLFYCLFIRAQINPHPSGWISLDFENTLLYGFTEKQANKIRLEDLSECVEYGFEVRVSGSTKPVLCFRVPEYTDDVVFQFESMNAYKKFEEILSYERDPD